MLRNLNALTPQGRRVLGTPFIGRLGSEILAASSVGTHGPGPLVNDGLSPTARYRMLVVNTTYAVGDLQIDELGRMVAANAGTAVYQLYEDNVLVQSAVESRTITVTVGAPVFEVTPTSITRQVGQSATFNAVVTGAGPLQLQWLRNGLAIPGATASSYTIPAVTVGDSGAVFALRAINPVQTIISQGATLTVTSTAPNPEAPGEPARQAMETVSGRSEILANRTYVGDVGTAIELDTETDLTGATVSMLVQKPNGDLVTWPATAQGMVARFLTRTGDLDQHGTWRMQVLVETFAGKWHGKTFRLRVYAAFK